VNRGGHAASQRALARVHLQRRALHRAILLGAIAALGAAFSTSGETAAPAIAADGAKSERALAGCASESAARVQAYYESVRDLEARFEQTTRSIAFGGGGASGEAISTGRVVIAKPGKMRWEYESPQPNLVVSDGATLWIYDPQAREAQKLDVASGYLTGAALAFLIGEGSLTEQFEVSALRCGPEEVELSLVPRKDSSYERLGLRLAASTGEVRETRVVDLFGNETSIRFSDVRRNIRPAATVFDFKPPAGTSVFDLMSPATR